MDKPLIDKSRYFVCIHLRDPRKDLFVVCYDPDDLTELMDNPSDYVVTEKSETEFNEHCSTVFQVISITSDVSGFFTVHYWWNTEDGGFVEPFKTGFGPYPKTIKGELEAIAEAKQLAEDEEIRLDPTILTREIALKRQLAASDRYGPFDMVAGQTNPNEDVP